ncbi:MULTISPECIES: SDR family NAD(P)-dependent oxidoreductase [Bacillus]|uniref:SDR family NAD(P)-dependent oxidoreductase n=1 Tax=Bacillus TaxID=1386 RepID=UPI000BB7FA89|nr:MULTISPECIES: SDR family oxidoreductase [Bacillus]
MTTVLITGAGTGLGRELSLEYARIGYTVILSGRNEETLLRVQKEIQSNGKKAYAFSLDITNYDELNSKVKHIVEEHNVQILINNAGVGCFGSLTALQVDDINQCLMTNVNGTIYMTKVFLPYLLSVPNAKVLNIISTAGLKGKVDESVYVASKYAIRGFTESLQKEWEGSIVFKAVYMGGMDTPFWNHSDHITDKTRLKDPKTIAEKIVQLDQEGVMEIVL